jgi:FecR protein
VKKSDHELIQEILDGQANEIQFHQFQERLRRQPQLRELYRSYALLHHCLAEEFEGQQLIGSHRPLPRRTVVRSSSPWRQALLATAAVLGVLASGVWWMNRERNPGAAIADGEPVAPAELRFSPDSSWRFEGEVDARDNGAALASGSRLYLDRGTAQITLNGVTGLIEAPAEVVYENPLSLRLEEGRGRFRVEPAGHGFTVHTQSLQAVDLGTEFAVLSHRDGADEVHVFEGKIEMRTPTAREAPLLAAGDAASVSRGGQITRMAADAKAFRKALPSSMVVLEDTFKGTGGSLHGRLPKIGRGAWELRHGQASLGGNGVSGGDFTGYCRLTGPSLDARHPFLMATLEVGPSPEGPFHGPGWAGLSLYSGGREVVFFGDSYGEARTWSLDIKQGLEPILPDIPLLGPRKVTLCYDWRSGLVTLHEGDRPNGPALVRGHLSPGLVFDEVRIGSSPEATISVKSVLVQVVEMKKE